MPKISEEDQGWRRDQAERVEHIGSHVGMWRKWSFRWRKFPEDMRQEGVIQVEEGQRASKRKRQQRRSFSPTSDVSGRERSAHTIGSRGACVALSNERRRGRSLMKSSTNEAVSSRQRRTPSIRSGTQASRARADREPGLVFPQGAREE